MKRNGSVRNQNLMIDVDEEVENFRESGKNSPNAPLTSNSTFKFNKHQYKSSTPTNRKILQPTTIANKPVGIHPKPTS